MYIIVRIQGYDDKPDIPMGFAEVRKVPNLYNDHMKIYEQDWLGHEAKLIGGSRVIDRISQTAHKINEDGSLTYVSRLDSKLPPRRKVKVINNPSKPTANWLSVLEQPKNEDEIDLDDEPELDPEF